MKKFLISLLLIVSMIMSNVLIFGANTNEATISIEVHEKAQVNDVISVKVNMTDATMAGGEFSLVYDNTLLDVISGEKGEEFAATGISSVITNNYTDNSCFFTFANAENINFNGCLAKFDFKVIKEGNAVFSFDKCSFSDYDLNDLIVTANGSEIVIGNDKTSSDSTETTETSTTETTTESSTTTEVSTETSTTETTTITTETSTETTTVTEFTTEKQTATEAKETTTEVKTEITTLQTTETSTETTETTTAASRPRTSGGGGGSSYRPATTTTTESTTESVTTEKTTEVTTAAFITKDVKVSVGSNIIYVGNDEFTIDAESYIQTSSNSTMVPLRFVAIAILGDDVEKADSSKLISWNADTKTAIITANGKTIKFTAESNDITVDNNTITMDYGVKAEIKDGRMFIPFRALGNALGVDVSWDSVTRTAIYKTK